MSFSKPWNWFAFKKLARDFCSFIILRIWYWKSTKRLLQLSIPGKINDSTVCANTLMRIQFSNIFDIWLLNVRFSIMVISSSFNSLTLTSLMPLQQILNYLSLSLYHTDISSINFVLAVLNTRSRFTISLLRQYLFIDSIHSWINCILYAIALTRDAWYLSYAKVKQDGPKCWTLRHPIFSYWIRWTIWVNMYKILSMGDN